MCQSDVDPIDHLEDSIKKPTNEPMNASLGDTQHYLTGTPDLHMPHPHTTTPWPPLSVPEGRKCESLQLNSYHLQKTNTTL